MAEGITVNIVTNSDEQKLKCPICGSTYIINHNLEAVLRAENAIYYRPHKHRNWKHEKYEVVCGDLIVNTVETENSAKILVAALRNYFVASHVTAIQQAERRGRAELVEQLLGNEEYPLSEKYFVRGEWLGRSLLETLHEEQRLAKLSHLQTRDEL